MISKIQHMPATITLGKDVHHYITTSGGAHKTKYIKKELIDDLLSDIKNIDDGDFGFVLFLIEKFEDTHND